jgi:hypothetical protein
MYRYVSLILYWDIANFRNGCNTGQYSLISWAPYSKIRPSRALTHIFVSKYHLRRVLTFKSHFNVSLKIVDEEFKLGIVDRELRLTNYGCLMKCSAVYSGRDWWTFQWCLLRPSGRWLMMVVVCTSETSVSFYHNITRDIPEGVFHARRLDNVKSHQVRLSLCQARSGVLWSRWNI